MDSGAFSLTSVSLVILIIVGSSCAQNSEIPHLTAEAESQNACKYEVEIKTSCTPFAGTGDKVSLVFGDRYGYRVYVPALNDPKRNTFDRCNTDKFTIAGPCLHEACYLYLYRHGSDSWKVSYVKVAWSSQGAANFKFEDYVPADTWFGFNKCKGKAVEFHHIRDTYAQIQDEVLEGLVQEEEVVVSTGVLSI